MQRRQTSFLTDPIMSSPTQTKWCSAKSFKEFLSKSETITKEKLRWIRRHKRYEKETEIGHA